MAKKPADSDKDLGRDPSPPEYNNENIDVLGRGAKYIEKAREAGGLPDDPTSSGAPVVDPTPFKKMKG